MPSPPPPQFLRALALSCSLAAIAGCSSDGPVGAGQPDGGCVPVCADGRCGVDDGCGGQCGCPLGAVCGADQRCAPDPCAACGEGEQCVDGACVCVPDCADRPCQDDGCGGTCECPEGLVQNAAGEWVPPAQCEDLCVSSGWVCGELCGQDCGPCAPGTTCDKGWCACEPSCDGTRCDDGCGGRCECLDGFVCSAEGDCVPAPACEGSCASEGAQCGEVCGEWCGGCPEGQSCLEGACRAALSCADCPLQLRVLGRTVEADRIVGLRVAVDFVPGDMPLPRLIDLRLSADRPVSLVSVKPGEALRAAGKALVQDDATGKPWRVRSDGSLQFLVLQAGNTETVGAGRLLELAFVLDDPGPLELALRRREQTFAPPESDAALQASGYDAALVVTR